MPVELLLDDPVIYKLIHIGKITIDYAEGGSSILCYFEPWLSDRNIPESNAIICRKISSTLAGTLVCGTLWSNAKLQKHLIDSPYPSYCTFSTGNTSLYARKLKHVTDIQNLAPADFWPSHKDTWVICIKNGEKQVIIPYFELLRVLFYQTSRRLTDFIFSQTPIQYLCRGLVYPDINNLFIARFCVAAENLSAVEARLLGCLLFDSELAYSFNISQAYCMVAASGDKAVLSDEEDTIAIGKFDRFHFNASGYEFSSGNERYFWVQRLDILQYNYKFNKLLFYPLTNNRQAGEMQLPICSDILKMKRRSVSFFNLKHVTSDNKLDNHKRVPVFKNNKREYYATREAGQLPVVVCRAPWATIPTGAHEYSYLGDGIFTQVATPLSDTSTDSAVQSERFCQLLDEFELHGYPVELMTLNNTEQVFGEKISVFPIDKYPPLPGIIDHARVKRFPLAKITLTNAIIYLAQPFPQINPELVLLIVKQSLTQLDISEWNELLEAIFPIYDSSALIPFYRKVSRLRRMTNEGRHASDNTAILAIPLPVNKIPVRFCLDLAEHILDRFRKRLQFFLATLLKYPQGITIKQRQHISALSHNFCLAPDALWKARISLYWETNYS